MYKWKRCITGSLDFVNKNDEPVFHIFKKNFDSRWSGQVFYDHKYSELIYEDSLELSFVLSDRAGSEFRVYFTGILPDLFREGQGILVEGELQQDGSFLAHEVLAKHDENYMPPELMSLAEEKQPKNTGG